MAVARHYLYPVWIRLWHWINAVSFILLLATGISIHFASAEGSFISFSSAVSIHNVAAIFFLINYGLFVVGNMVSGNGKYYKDMKEDMGKNLMTQARFYISGIFRGEPHPFAINEERKFNPLQKISYVAVMYVCMPLVIISGLGLMFPETILMQVFGLSGLALTDLLHLVMAFVLSIFLLIHLYTCTLGDKPGTLFKSMINGYHEESH
jgi:thiosulfate reductase cytochrome b subunit